MAKTGMRIVTAPDSALTTPTRPVHRIDKKIKRLVGAMEETLVRQSDPQGVGLAAPQVGISLSLFIIKPKPSSETKVFINPKIIQTFNGKDVILGNDNDSRIDSGQARMTKKEKKSGDEKMEGCLSVPRIWAPLKRSKKVQVEYQDLEGKTHTEWFSGLNAVIVQHEIDHLVGKLFTERCLEQKVPMYEEKGEKLVKLKNV